MTDEPASEQPSPPILRAGRGRWLGGVCAGLQQVSRVRAAWLRVAFVLAALCGGVGAVVYLACWTIIPTNARAAVADAPEPRASGATALGWGVAGLLLAVLLAAFGAGATVFGFGWLVFGIAALLLVVLMRERRAARQVTGLVMLSCLVLPAVGIALSPLRLKLQTADTTVAPTSATQFRGTTYSSGLGTMLVDLRRTRFPRRGVVRMQIHAGLRRTIVALPTAACVHVRVNYTVHTFPLRLAALVSGDDSMLFSGLVLFGQTAYNGLDPEDSGTTSRAGGGSGPTLVINFTSEGGSLFVRDYPTAVSPNDNPNWPGFVSGLDPRPQVGALSKSLARRELRAWKRRRAAEVIERRQVGSLMFGPCGVRS